METTTKERTFNASKTIKNDPNFFSAYLNQATNNMFNIIAHINDIMVGKSRPNKDDHSIFECGVFQILKDGKLNKDEQPVEKISGIISLLNKHFPFLNWMIEKELFFRHGKEAKDQEVKPDNEDYYEVLHKLISYLVHYRNFFTHYPPVEIVFDGDLIEYLRASFDASRNAIKERFGYNKDDVKHLIRSNKKAAKRKKENGIYLDDKGFHYSFYHNDYALSDKGIIYLTCLFLEPRYSQLFLKQLHGFKDSTEKNKQATVHAFAAYGVRLPLQRITSDDSKTGLMLNILGELQKCPDQLFEHLSNEEQKKFRPLGEIEFDTETDVNEVLLKRFEDRFPELILNYFDKMNCFPNLRFQVMYGRFYFKTYAGSGVSENRIRRLFKNLYAFDTIENINKDKAESTLFQSNLVKSSEIERHEEKPYILDIHPKHYINNNQLFVSLKAKPLNANELIKELSDKEFEKPKGILPDFAISRYDLPAMFLLDYLYKQSGNKNTTIENTLQQWRMNIKKCFTDIKEAKLQPVATTTLINFNSSLTKASESEKATYQTEFENRKKLLNIQLATYDLTCIDIPKFFRDHLLNIAPPKLNQKAKAIINRLVEETNHLLKRMDKQISQKKKAGKRGSKIIESGKLADYLARDMMQFQQPLEGVKNEGLANSTQFQVLQSSMAFWEREQDKLPTIFSQLNLLQQHPFLKEVTIDEVGIYTFFKSYFKAKVNYLNTVLNKIETNSTALSDYYFINLKERSNISQRAENLMNTQPIQLPADFFYRKLYNHIERHLPNFYATLNAMETQPTANYLIQQYFAVYNNDEPQNLYDKARSYRIYNQWLDKRNKKTMTKPLEPKYLSVEERTKGFQAIKTKLADKQDDEQIQRGIIEKTKMEWLRGLKYIRQNESHLRSIKTEDVLLYLAAMKIFKEELPKLNVSDAETVDKIKLKVLASAKETSIFERQVDFKLPYNFIDEQNNEQIISITDRMKMKDYGKFRRFLKDRRLPNLMAYYETETITKTVLEEELHAYEVNRIAVLKAIYEFEKAAYEKFNSHFEAIRVQDGGIVSHKFYLQHLAAQNFINNEEEKLMKEFRNRFAHNQYPPKNVCSFAVDKNKKEHIAAQLAKAAIKIYEDTIKKMNATT